MEILKLHFFETSLVIIAAETEQQFCLPKVAASIINKRLIKKIILLPDLAACPYAWLTLEEMGSSLLIIFGLV